MPPLKLDSSQSDICPLCSLPLQIVALDFRLKGPRGLWACSGCGLAMAESAKTTNEYASPLKRLFRGGRGSKELLKKLRRPSESRLR